MRLAEAIGLGAMVSPQTRGRFFKRAISDGEGVYATCALGAAAIAVGGSVFDSARNAYSTWPILGMLVPAAELPPAVSALKRPLRLAEAIILLNDRHGWTRTEIAHWVEQFERRHLPALLSRDARSSIGIALEAGDPDDADSEAVAAVVR